MAYFEWLDCKWLTMHLGYEIVNLAPKLAVRRDWKCCFNDTGDSIGGVRFEMARHSIAFSNCPGLLLAKKSLMSKYKCVPQHSLSLQMFAMAMS